MRIVLATIVISATISLCYASPIRNRQVYLSEKSSKSDSIPEKEKIPLYRNETLLKYSEQSIPIRLGQDKEKQNYYVLVVTVPETTTARSQQILEPEISPLLIKDVETDIPVMSKEESISSEPATTAAPAQAQAPTGAPSLINAIGNVLVHTIRGNFSGIVDESFGPGVSAPLVTVLNNLLSDTSCNTIRRLLGQCRSPGSDPRPEDPQKALLLSVII